MAFSINTNAGALLALRQLAGSTADLGEVQNRVSTGLKVRTASDDPANFSIAQNLRAQSASFDAVRSSLDRATSTLDVAIAAAETISDLLIDARETAIAAADQGIDGDSRKALSDEYNRLLAQIDSVVSQANFNGTNLVDPSLTRITALTGTQVGFNDTNSNGIADPGEARLINTLDINGRDLTTAGIGLTTKTFNVTSYDTTINNLGDIADRLGDRNFITALVAAGNPAGIIDDSTNPATFDFSGATFIDTNGTPGSGDESLSFSLGGQTFTIAGTFADAVAAETALRADFALATPAAAIPITSTPANGPFSTAVAAEVAVVEVDAALDQVNSVLAEFGAAARQLQLSTQFTARLSDQITVGIGNLVDADLARESANLQALQVKQQLGLQTLSIANRAPQSLLSLFGN